MVAKYRKWPFSAPHRTKTPQPIRAKICTIDNVGKTTKQTKVHKDRSGGRGSPYRWSLRLAEFSFLVTCWASPQPTSSARVPHIIHQSTRFRSRSCHFGGLSDTSHPMAELSPKKTLIFGTSTRISSLKVYGRISAQEKHITTLDGSKCASRQDTRCSVLRTEG
jgi:hypothetical protein